MRGDEPRASDGAPGEGPNFGRTPHGDAHKIAKIS
jgi:hypothetical protein